MSETPSTSPDAPNPKSLNGLPNERERRELPEVSIIVPFYNEENTVRTLIERIHAVMEGVESTFEIVFVDDGSTDGSREYVTAAISTYPTVRLVAFRRNFGKAAALSAGFAHSSGKMVVTMDADLQDDPIEIPNFIAKIKEGYDVVSGWKKERHDPWTKTLPSRIFNAVLSRAFGVKIHDFNCGFKAYTRTTVAQLNLCGELHRFTPVLLNAGGFKITEIPVRHHARNHGHTKFGADRFVKAILDLITTVLITRYLTRPLHLFGMIGIPLIVAGFAICGYLTVLWFLGMGPIGDRPLLLLGILGILAGMQFVGFGLIAEMVGRLMVSEDQKYVIETIEPNAG